MLIIIDGLELVGKEIEVLGWLEDDSKIVWLRNFLIVLVIFGIGMGVGYYLEWVFVFFIDWIVIDVVLKFLIYFMIVVVVIVVVVFEGLVLSVILSFVYSI